MGRGKGRGEKGRERIGEGRGEERLKMWAG